MGEAIGDAADNTEGMASSKATGSHSKCEPVEIFEVGFVRKKPSFAPIAPRRGGDSLPVETIFRPRWFSMSKKPYFCTISAL